MLHDGQGRILMSNPLARELLGLSEDQLIGMDHTDPRWHFLREDGTVMSVDEYPVSRVLASRRPLRGYLTGLMRADHDDAAWMLVNAEPDFGDDGELSRILVSFMDLTERRRVEEALRLSERRHLQAQAMGHVGNWEYDLQTTEFWGSDEAKRLYGFDPLGTNFSTEEVENCIPERERVHQALVDLIEAGKPYDLEFEIHPCDGSAPRIIASRAELARDADGRPWKVSGVILDITDRKQAEVKLRRLNRDLQAISDCNQALLRAGDERALLNEICRIAHEGAGYHLVWVGYVEHDEAKTVRPVAWAGQGSEYVAAAQITWSADEARGRGPAGVAIRSQQAVCVQDFLTDPRMAPWREAAERYGYRSGVALPLVDDHARAFGVLLIYSAEPDAITKDELRLLQELAGDLSYGITTLRARAEHDRAERALVENEAKTRSILDHIGIGVSLISPRMEILELNRQMRRWFPAIDPTQRPICHRSFNEPPREERCDGCPTCTTLQDGLVHEATMETQRDGAIRHYRIISSPVLDTAGTITGAIEMVEDTTARIFMEAQLRQVQKMDAVGRLAGGVAHDFNNMLGVILGHVELALEEAAPGTRLFDDLREIQKAARHSSELTRQLLAFARKQTIAPTVIDLNEAVTGMISMIRRLIGEDLALTWNPEEVPCPVLMDRSQIDQVLVNLCVNARDAITGGGRITISTGSVSLDEAFCARHAGATPGEYVRLTVADNGCGMEPEVLRNIFEPFFTTKGLGQGTGLGLSMVYGVVKQNHGFISVESAPKVGTAFQLFFPRHTGARPELPAKPSGRVVAGAHETLLLVEDEASLLRLGTMLLERLGYHVLPASAPGEAIRLAQAHAGEIDLLITDVVMPEMTGRELSLRLSSTVPTLRVLYMSGYTANVIADQGILDAGVHFIQKPFSKADLARKVREALGKGE